MENLPQPGNEIGLGVVKFQAPGHIKLDEMGTTPIGQVTPALSDLSGERRWIEHAWDGITSSRQIAAIIFS